MGVEAQKDAFIKIIKEVVRYNDGNVIEAWEINWCK